MIKIEHLKKEYSNVTPLKDISTEIHDGDVICVIGPSGTGKSTLLRCINQLEKPTSGKIWVDGVEITDPGCDINKVRLKMGMVFQHFNLFGHKTVIENIMMAPMDLLGKPKQEAYDTGMRLLRTVGLAEKAMNYPDELSGGQKQRIAIARTLAMDPEVILLDEPTSALDPTMVGEVQAVIRELAKTGKTMMTVTHEMNFARAISNRVFYMDEGVIYEEGTPEQFFDHPQREKTRRFVNRLKVLELTIESRDYDFLGMAGEIAQYCNKSQITPVLTNRIQLAFEESVNRLLIPSLKNPRIQAVVEYSEEAELTYSPPMFIRINSVITTAISLFSTIVLYYLAVSSGIDQSNYFAFMAAYGSVMGAFSSLAGIALSVGRIKPILEMAEPFLKTEPETADNKEMVTKLSGSIELNNVYFRYSENSPYIVNNLSLSIKSGEYVAIVGKTGCGKSTLMRLLLGFEKPEKGAIYYDGKDLDRLDLTTLRRKIGTVIQGGGLLQGDIFSNIIISAPHLTHDEAWEAAELAGIADDIRTMPMGMQTLISEGHGGISGGQKQRLMIARAIAPKPKILMFDEATSALDNKTQKQVSEALDKMGCTRIVIAHRLSTIRHCDRILVLDGGKVIEEGSYDELIAQNGYFAELVERQRLDK